MVRKSLFRVDRFITGGRYHRSLVASDFYLAANTQIVIDYLVKTYGFYPREERRNRHDSYEYFEIDTVPMDEL